MKKRGTRAFAIAGCTCALIICVSFSRSEELPQSEPAVVQDILNDPVTYRRNLEKLQSIANPNRVLNDLMLAAKKTPANKRVILLDLIADLGAPVYDHQAVATPRYHLIYDENVIDFLVTTLSDLDAEVREKAVNILTTRVEGRRIIPRANVIIEALSTRTNEVPARLLGITREPAALDLLKKTKQGKSADLHETKLAMAMLGDTNSANAIIAQYNAAKNPDEKASIAKDLAYIGSSKAMLALVSDLRSPLIMRWGGEGRRSFRLIAIESFSWCYPTEPILWKPRIAPTSDKYYEGIEKWAERTFHVQWDRPRPPFLYEEYGLMGGPEIWSE